MFTATVLSPLAFLNITSHYSAIKTSSLSEEILDKSFPRLMLLN